MDRHAEVEEVAMRYLREGRHLSPITTGLPDGVTCKVESYGEATLMVVADGDTHDLGWSWAGLREVADAYAEENGLLREDVRTDLLVVSGGANDDWHVRHLVGASEMRSESTPQALMGAAARPAPRGRQGTRRRMVP